MDFWDEYQKERSGPSFGAGRLWLKTGERYNASISRLQDRSVEVQRNSAAIIKYSPEGRYLIAKEITFELFASFYDVNSRSIMAFRSTLPLDRHEKERIRSAIRGWRNPNLEIRAIGMQNNDLTLAEEISSLKKLAEGSVVELDLFGNETRHIIIDLLTGKPYSLLLLNRIYRPGELINQVRKEDFDKNRSKFVI